jgi:cysteine synthase B
VQGLNNLGEVVEPKLYQLALSSIDRHVIVSTEESYANAREIVAQEGIFVGMSAGCALGGVLKILPEVPAGSVIFVIFPDRGEKYLTTPLFPYDEQNGEAVVGEIRPGESK